MLMKVRSLEPSSGALSAGMVAELASLTVELGRLEAALAGVVMAVGGSYSYGEKDAEQIC